MRGECEARSETLEAVKGADVEGQLAKQEAAGTAGGGHRPPPPFRRAVSYSISDCPYCPVQRDELERQNYLSPVQNMSAK